MKDEHCELRFKFQSRNVNALDKTIAKPKGSVPKFGLPRWKLMPLEHKIPMIPAPKNAYKLVRRKVGRKLWATEPKMEFDLNDPYCHVINFPYEPLHDEHLRVFFSKPANMKHLLKTDLITDDMDVKCSLRDYNMYRSYLGKIYADRIKKELKKGNRLFIEKRTLNYAEDQARKEARRFEEKERLARTRQHIMQRRLAQGKSKMHERREKVRRTTQRLKLLRFVKQEEQRLINIKRRERAELIRQKCKTVAEVTQRMLVGISLDWERRDKARTKAKSKRVMNIKQQKQKAVERRWRRKQCFQEQDITKQKILLQRINICRQQFIKNYNDKINKETARMQRLLDNVKLYANCYAKRHLSDGKERICCKKYFGRNVVKHAKKHETMSKIFSTLNIV